MSDRGAVLLGLAREAIATAFAGADVTPPPLAWLEEPRAVFVTLRDRHGDLRGCIGTIDARRPLGEAVIDAARGAAFRDGRFGPLEAGELDEMRIDVSVLSPMTALHVSGEVDAIDQLARTKPGVLFSCGGRRSVLLPSCMCLPTLEKWHPARAPPTDTVAPWTPSSTTPVPRPRPTRSSSA